MLTRTEHYTLTALTYLVIAAIIIGIIIAVA